MQSFDRVEDIKHLLPILFPIGHTIDIATGDKLIHQQSCERFLDEPPFVVFLFRPGIGKEYVEARHGRGCDHVFQHLDSIEAHEPEVRQAFPSDCAEQLGESAEEYFDGEEVCERHLRSDAFSCVPHAEPDLHDHGIVIFEDLSERQHPCVIKWNHELFAIQFQGFLLVRSEPGSTQHETFDAAFISGTSPKFLPIRKIGDADFDPENKVVKQLISTYNEMIAAYVKKQSSFL